MTVTHCESMKYGSLRADLDTAIRAVENSAYACRRLDLDEWSRKLLECSERLKELKDQLNTDEMWARYVYGMPDRIQTEEDG